MAARIEQQGHYELFETNHRHQVLVLNGSEWFAWMEGQQGEILVQSDEGHVKDHTLADGDFYLVDFEGDPKFKDMPHLFLQRDGSFQELMVPNGLPSDQDRQKLIVPTDEKLTAEQLEDYLRHPGQDTPAKEREALPDGGFMSSVADCLAGIALPADRNEIPRHARENSAPEAVIEQLNHLDEGQYRDVAEVMRHIHVDEE